MCIDMRTDTHLRDAYQYASINIFDDVHRYAYRYASSRCVPIRIFENAINEAAYRYASLRCVPIRIFETPLTKLKMLLITHRCH